MEKSLLDSSLLSNLEHVSINVTHSDVHRQVYKQRKLIVRKETRRKLLTSRVILLCFLENTE